MEALIVGAGVAGLTCAVELAERGAHVEVIDRAPAFGPQSCSWYAGGMLAPRCECESAPDFIATLGLESIAWWRDKFPGTVRAGTLVVAHGRDQGELAQFARRTREYERLNQQALAALEPDLAERFGHALFFPEEAHLDPREALPALAERLRAQGVSVRWGVDVSQVEVRGRAVVDCTGLAARRALPDLRGVKGEMVLLRARGNEVKVSRPVRVLHPRVPVYIVPREAGCYMVGATMIESDDSERITARSMLELLSAAYALHPALGEAEIVETGAQVRPAFPDNLPHIRWGPAGPGLPRLAHADDRVQRRQDVLARCRESSGEEAHCLQGRALYVNGLFRHGFLIAPALARRVAEHLLHGRFFPELMDEDTRERRLA